LSESGPAKAVQVFRMRGSASGGSVFRILAVVIV